jgi:putative ABC transport system permease protein
VLAGTLATRRFATLAVGAFSGLALLLACVGIYGVISFLVAQRSNEIGVRVALGASPRDIIGQVMGHGWWLAVAGVGIGGLAALAITRLISGLLFGIGAFDPVAFAGAAAALTGVALAASAVPARRAARVDPLQALRNE